MAWTSDNQAVEVGGTTLHRVVAGTAAGSGSGRRWSTGRAG
jgi:hypothetical protein